MEALNPTNFTVSADDDDDDNGGAFWTVRTDSRDRSAILVLVHTTYQSSQ